MYFYLAIIAVLLLFWRSRVYVHIAYGRREGRDHADITVKVLRVLSIYHLHIDNLLEYALDQGMAKALKLNGAETRVHSGATVKARKKWPDLNAARIRRIISQGECNELTMNAVVAGGDAALTALLYGVSHALWGGIVALLEQQMKVSPNIRIKITPSFKTNNSNIQAQCIVSSKIGHVIAIMLK